MSAFRGVRTRSSAVALFAVLVMLIGAANASAGGGDHGNWTGQQDQAWGDNSEQDESWQPSEENRAGDQGQSGDTEGNTDCEKNREESQAGTEQPSGYPPQSQEQGGTEQGQKTEQRPEVQGEQTSGSGQQPATAPVTQAPAGTAPVTTQAQQTPNLTTPAPVTPNVEGESRGEQGGRVLAETTQPTAAVAQANTAQAGEELAHTGSDVWKLALVGTLCLAGAALLIRRARRA